MRTVKQYISWLERTLNRKAESLRSYVAYAGESPPEKDAEQYRILQKAWDSYCYFVDKDDRYANLLPEQVKTKYTHEDALENYKLYLHKELAPMNPAGFETIINCKLPEILKWNEK